MDKKIIQYRLEFSQQYRNLIKFVSYKSTQNLEIDREVHNSIFNSRSMSKQKQYIHHFRESFRNRSPTNSTSTTQKQRHPERDPKEKDETGFPLFLLYFTHQTIADLIECRSLKNNVFQSKYMPLRRNMGI